MKLSIFIVFLIGMAGCTSLQLPVVKETTIAGLEHLPDTIDFWYGSSRAFEDFECDV